MAVPKGFEPLTHGVEIRCAIQLRQGTLPYHIFNQAVRMIR
jgi:hypothetical protein